MIYAKICYNLVFLFIYNRIVIPYLEIVIIYEVTLVRLPESTDLINSITSYRNWFVFCHLYALVQLYNDICYLYPLLLLKLKRDNFDIIFTLFYVTIFLLIIICIILIYMFIFIYITEQLYGDLMSSFIPHIYLHYDDSDN